MYGVVVDLLNYLTDSVSKDNYDHTPSTIRRYSLQIHLLFTGGEAPSEIASSLEKFFFLMKRRKSIDINSRECESWENELRDEVKKFRVNISKYLNKSKF